MLERLLALIKRKPAAKKPAKPKAKKTSKPAAKKPAAKKTTAKAPAPRSGTVARPKKAASPKPALQAA